MSDYTTRLVEALAADIRHLDDNHSMSAAELAECLVSLRWRRTLPPTQEQRDAARDPHYWDGFTDRIHGMP